MPVIVLRKRTDNWPSRRRLTQFRRREKGMSYSRFQPCDLSFDGAQDTEL